jgi:hypothetical protein
VGDKEQVSDGEIEEEKNGDSRHREKCYILISSSSLILRRPALYQLIAGP